MYGHVLRTSLSLGRNLTKKLLSHCESQRYLTVHFHRGFCTAEEYDLSTNQNPSEIITLTQELKSKQELDKLLEDPEKSKLYTTIEMEAAMLRAQGEPLPAKLTARQILILLEAPNPSQRRKYFRFLILNQFKNMGKKSKVERKKESGKARVEEFSFDHLQYGLHHNTMFLRLYKTTMNMFRNAKLALAMQYAPKVVFDLSYDHTMAMAEITNCAKQLLIAYSDNRTHIQPFNLYMCGAKPEYRVVQQLQRLIPLLLNDDFMLNVTPQSYTEIFDKKELVYLTPHCNTPLREFDSDLVYIIGAIVDKRNSQPLSLAKAKKEGIQMRKLPMDNYLHWGAGSGKSLPLNIVLNILLDLHYTEDWRFALQHVPRRKLQESSQTRLLKKLQRTEYLLDSRQDSNIIRYNKT